ncbi:hypothetical protein [Pseudomonas vranovensis]|uniref:hypothetical protein n=1 Tax=Pseudomonas vranovensis TaxID=321661 RepID=UPI003D95D645
MADLPERIEWTPGIYQWETSDPVLGGPDGIDNRPTKELANRTRWLKDQIEKLISGEKTTGKASRLETARALKFKGAGTGLGSFDGSADVEIALTLADSGVQAGVFTKVEVSAKGIVTAASNPTTLSGYGITDAMAKGAGGLMTYAPVIEGKIAQLPATQFYSVVPQTTDRPASIEYGTGVHIKFPDGLTGFDLLSGISTEWYGVRQFSGPGAGVWRTLWHSGNFDPASKADTTAMASALGDKADKSDLVLPLVTVTASKSLTAAELGLVLVDASSGAVTVTLPPSNTALGVRDVVIRRVDGSGSSLWVQAAGAEKIKFHTHLRPEGYRFFPLLGVGDFWVLRSDGAGSWYPLSRLDDAPLGRVFFETTVELPPGGYGAPNGNIFTRSSWPWLWDFAQKSGMVVADSARIGMEGCWTLGDGVSTFRGPDVRGEHIRIHDELRGVEPGREPGSWRPDQLKVHGHTYNVASANTGTGGTQNPIPTDTPGVTKLTNPTGSDENRVRTIAFPARMKLI